uniref:Uncharacterized protein n=1 Tax=Arion vulgaris TaxID=1028688 RepID=A0A0B7AH88_9EUPU
MCKLLACVWTSICFTSSHEIMVSILSGVYLHINRAIMRPPVVVNLEPGLQLYVNDYNDM